MIEKQDNFGTSKTTPVKIVEQVKRQEGRYAKRNSFVQVKCDLVPVLPATYLGKVKLGNIKDINVLEAALSIRGITGWTSRDDVI